MRHNKEGLTFAEWRHAAGYTITDGISPYQWRELRRAWKAGEDPTEYRAA
jgi:hypothetical protein